MERIGKYEVIGELGSGGFGAVYKCRDPQLDREVAVKVFRPRDANVAKAATSASGDAAQVLRERFIEEARVLHDLGNHPNIVSIREFSELEDSTPYYVMPYLPRSLVDEMGKDAMDPAAINDLAPELRPRRLPLPRVIDILSQISAALAEVHRSGLVHRDIKPANILFNEKNEVQVVDFGIAKLPEAEHSQTGVGMGSRDYMSPEQRESAKHVDARSDMYSLGVLAYRMLTGALPVGRYSDPIDLIPEAGKPLSDLIIAALSPTREGRPKDAVQFLTQFKQAIGQANPDDATEFSSTFVEGSGAQTRSELTPLIERIEALLLEHGEVPEDQAGRLETIAAVADLDPSDLAALIKDTELRLGAKIKPIRNFLNHIDQTLERGPIDEARMEAFVEAASGLGWSEAKVKETIASRSSLGSAEAKGKQEDTGFEFRIPLFSKIAAGFMLIALLGSVGSWWLDEQERSAAAVIKNDSNDSAIVVDEKVAPQDPSAEQLLEGVKARYEVGVAIQIKDFNDLDVLDAAESDLLEYMYEHDGQRYEDAEDLYEWLGLQRSQFDTQFFREAQQENTIESYQAYQSYYPSGMYIVEAEEAIVRMADGKEVQTDTDQQVVVEYVTGSFLPEVGRVFKDCRECPEMIIVPPGSFNMGSLPNEKGREDDEGPQHRVNIPQPFAVGVYELTFDEWAPCVTARACRGHVAEDYGYGRGSRPVINVSWNDAQDYVRWLSSKTAQSYRLLTESEWEYVARGGTETRYWWGDDLGQGNANFNVGDGFANTSPVGSFKPNDFGLYDVLGNVNEWLQDCRDNAQDYMDAPIDGTAQKVDGECKWRRVRGGSWMDRPGGGMGSTRVADRGFMDNLSRQVHLGFRVARNLN